MFKLYISKINKDVNYLWQRPKQGSIHYTDEKWYDHQRVGKDPLECYMKMLSKDLKLSNPNYTNHSIRATCITLLDRAQFEARHIIAITGHKSESTIKKYAKGCSSEKKREMSEALASKIKPKIPKLENSENAAAPVPPPVPEEPNFDISNMEIFPIDSQDDDILLEFLKKNLTIDKSVPNTAICTTYCHQCEQCTKYKAPIASCNTQNVFPKQQCHYKLQLYIEMNSNIKNCCFSLTFKEDTSH